MIDALKAGPLAAEGHRVVNRYAMEARLPLVQCPVQVLAPTADPHAFPVAGKVTGAISGVSMIEIAAGMVPFPDQMPEVFAGPSLPSWRASIRLGRAICQDLRCTEAWFCSTSRK
jgi:hypothetical protein